MMIFVGEKQNFLKDSYVNQYKCLHKTIERASIIFYNNFTPVLWIDEPTIIFNLI
jgi:hypothetical protein